MLKKWKEPRVGWERLRHPSGLKPSKKCTCKQGWDFLEAKKWVYSSLCRSCMRRHRQLANVEALVNDRKSPWYGGTVTVEADRTIVTLGRARMVLNVTRAVPDER